MIEHIEKALHDAQFLEIDIREAHTAATESNRLAEIILFELTPLVVDVRQRLTRLEAAL